jgi:DNA-binding transcriptional MerR regulator
MIGGGDDMADDTNDEKGHTEYTREYTEKAYTTSETARMMDIAVPTVRKYSQSLENHGYVFVKGKGTGQYEARLFLEKDIQALRYLKDIREKGGITVKQATSIVIERFGKGAIQDVRSKDIRHNAQSDRQYDELKEMIQQQNNLIMELTNEVRNQKHYIDDRLNERDRVLMQTLKESQETKKQIAAAEEKKGFWSKLFKK